MAEARAGVRPHPTVSRIGFEVDTGRKEVQLHIDRSGLVLYIPHPRFLIRNGVKRVRRLYAKAAYACVPFPPWLPPMVVAGVAAWVVRSPGHSWQRSGRLANALWSLDRASPITKIVEKILGGPEKLSTQVRVTYLAAIFTAGCTAAITMTQRLILRKLLTYHSWLKEGQGKLTLKTKIWGFLMKNVFVRGGKIGGTYVYQDILPTLPVPKLEDTVDRYLESMAPLLDNKEMSELQNLAKDFKQKEGRTLQWWLKVKWWMSGNYLSDWWLNFVYLRGRDPLPINSNWYGVITEKFIPTQDVAARAASVTHNFLRCKQALENETFPALLAGGVAPLCMAQYEKAFSVTRIPGREQDTLIKSEPGESKHIVVIYKGRFYKLQVYNPKEPNSLLTPLQLYRAIKGIINPDDEMDQDRAQESSSDDGGEGTGGVKVLPEPEEAGLPALTTMNRTEWAEVRHSHFMTNAYNRERLDIIEKAAFVLCLDPDNLPNNLSEEAKHMLCGTGRSFWCDKSLNLIVNGKCQTAIHCEHSWGDAPVMGHMLEICGNNEIAYLNYNKEDGSIKATAEDMRAQNSNPGGLKVYPAERIKFNMTKELRRIVDRAEKEYQLKIQEVDFHTLSFEKYGKDIPKKAKCSPDSWIQMAFQLAYWRDQGRFDQTYEASMTRLFGQGRTETVRSACTGSAKFVKLMEAEGSDNNKAEKLAALREACDHHQGLARDAMVGKGCDRHLFALYVVSVGKSIDSPFLKFALGRKWKLSTSQTPNQQTGRENLACKNQELYKTPNGGFGPVADDGYGISYVLYPESFYFNISAKNTNCSSPLSSPAESPLEEEVGRAATSAARMADQVERALLEMAELVA